MAIELRDYQRESVHHTWQYLKLYPGSPVIVLPTGAGKSIVIAELVRRVVKSGRRGGATGFVGRSKRRGLR